MYVYIFTSYECTLFRLLYISHNNNRVIHIFNSVDIEKKVLFLLFKFYWISPFQFQLKKNIFNILLLMLWVLSICIWCKNDKNLLWVFGFLSSFNIFQIKLIKIIYSLKLASIPVCYCVFNVLLFIINGIYQ